MESRRRPLTLLQRGVISRLRQAGYHLLADTANENWSCGERCRLPKIVHPQHAELFADFDKANAQIAEGQEQ